MKFLRSEGYDVFSITEENPSIDDLSVLQKAYSQKRVLITNDKGFSKLIFKDKKKSEGVILIRMPFDDTVEKISRLQDLLINKSKDLQGSFATITKQRIRIKRI